MNANMVMLIINTHNNNTHYVSDTVRALPYILISHYNNKY